MFLYYAKSSLVQIPELDLKSGDACLCVVSSSSISVLTDVHFLYSSKQATSQPNWFAYALILLKTERQMRMFPKGTTININAIFRLVRRKSTFMYIHHRCTMSGLLQLSSVSRNRHVDLFLCILGNSLCLCCSFIFACQWDRKKDTWSFISCGTEQTEVCRLQLDLILRYMDGETNSIGSLRCLVSTLQVLPLLIAFHIVIQSDVQH